MTSGGGLPRTYWLIWAALFVGSAGRFVVPFLSTYLTVSVGVPTGRVGAIVACYGIGGVAAALLGAALSDRFGRIRVVTAAQLSSAALLGAVAFTRNPLAIAVLLLMFGAASNLGMPALAALIADIVPPPLRARAYLLQAWALNCGFVIGPLAGAFLIQRGSTMFWVEGTVLVAVAVFLRAVLGRRVRGGPTVVAVRPGFSMADAYRRVLSDRLFLAVVAVVLVYTAVYFQSTTTLPIVMERQHISTAAYGALLSLNGLLLCVLQVPLVRLLERMPRAVTLALALLLTAVGFALQIRADSLGMYAVAVVAWTLGELGTFPVATALAASLAPATHRGTYQGFYNLTWSGGNALAPLVGDAVLASRGSGVLWAACTGLLMIGAAALLRMRRAIGAREAAAVLTDAAPSAAESLRGETPA